MLALFSSILAAKSDVINTIDKLFLSALLKMHENCFLVTFHLVDYQFAICNFYSNSTCCKCAYKHHFLRILADVNKTACTSNPCAEFAYIHVTMLIGLNTKTVITKKVRYALPGQDQE